MRCLPPKVLRGLRDLVASLPEDVPNVSARRCDGLVAAIDAVLKPKRAARPAAKRRKAKKATRREEVADVRAVVMARAEGKCECCGTPANAFDALELDHFFGGRNRKALESPETTWALLHSHHVFKTRNSPDAAYWLTRFIDHVREHGFTGAHALALRRAEDVKARAALSAATL